MKNIETHKKASEKYVGKPVKIENGLAVVDLKTNEEMTVDEEGLVHGGFVFGLADLAAMLSVNEKTVVLGGSNVKFTSPVKVDDELRAEAEITERENGKITVKCEVRNKDTGKNVLEGNFDCYVLKNHVLKKD